MAIPPEDPNDARQATNPESYPPQKPSDIPKSFAIGTGMFLPAVLILVVAVIVILWLL